jgi:hypothetical protein
MRPVSLRGIVILVVDVGTVGVVIHCVSVAVVIMAAIPKKEDGEGVSIENQKKIERKRNLLQRRHVNASR